MQEGRDDVERGVGAGNGSFVRKHPLVDRKLCGHCSSNSSWYAMHVFLFRPLTFGLRMSVYTFGVFFIRRVRLTTPHQPVLALDTLRVGGRQAQENRLVFAEFALRASKIGEQ